jgi:hypothetical protein
VFQLSHTFNCHMSFDLANHKHSATEPYEWYQSYHGIRHLLTPFHLSASQGMNPAKPRRILEALIPRLSATQEHFPSRNKCRILVVGCGNSRLPEDYDSGWLDRGNRRRRLVPHCHSTDESQVFTAVSRQN